MSTEHFERLADNLEDLIAEEQAKLGYRKEEVRLYYPMGSLQHLLENENGESPQTADEMQHELERFSDYAQDKFGKITITHQKERFCFHLPEEAGEYVRSHKDKNVFIYDLIELVGRHETKLEDVVALFERQPDKCIVQEAKDEEFDILIRFADAKDRYYYCFKDEGFHVIYHRFLPEDYADLYPEGGTV